MREMGLEETGVMEKMKSMDEMINSVIDEKDNEETIFNKRNAYDKNFRKFIALAGKLNGVEMLGVARLLGIEAEGFNEESEGMSEEEINFARNKHALDLIEQSGTAFLALIRSQQNRLLKIMKDAVNAEDYLNKDEKENEASS